MIHVVAGINYLFEALGFRPGQVEYSQALRAINPLIGRPVRSVRAPSELAAETVFGVLSKFHNRAFALLQSVAPRLIEAARSEMIRLALHNYQFPNFTLIDETVRNSLAIHGLLPHGSATFEEVVDAPRPVFMPDLALGPCIMGYLIHPEKLRMDNSGDPGNMRVLDVLQHSAEKMLALECHLCDPLSDVYSRAMSLFGPQWNEAALCEEQLSQPCLTKGVRALIQGELDRLFGLLPRDPARRSSLRDDSILGNLVRSAENIEQQLAREKVLPDTENYLRCRLAELGKFGPPVGGQTMFVIDAILHGSVGRRNLRRLYPAVPSVVDNELLKESAIKQGIAKAVIQEIVPSDLWASFLVPVRHFLLDAARIVGAARCRPASAPIPVEGDVWPMTWDAAQLGGEFDLDRYRSALQRAGLFDAVRDLTQQNKDRSPQGRSWWNQDCVAAITETLEALYSYDVQLSHRLRDTLDLYPLHKRVLGLVEYIIVPRLKSKGLSGAASSLWATAFTGASQLCPAALPPRADWWATLEALGNWLFIANGHGGGGSGLIDLAALLDDILSRMSSAPEVSGVSVTLSPVTPSAHAQQLADLADPKNEKAACLTFYLGKVVLQLRNAIEHGTDQVVSTGLRVDCPGFWAGKPGMSLDQLKPEARRHPQWRLESELRHLSPIPAAAKAILLTPESLQRCLVLLSLVLHAGCSQLGLNDLSGTRVA